MSAQDFFFADPALVARYVDGPPRFVPGHQDMLRMAAMLLAEDAPAHAKVLVVGAGGGIIAQQLRAPARAGEHRVPLGGVVFPRRLWRVRMVPSLRRTAPPLLEALSKSMPTEPVSIGQPSP